MLVTFLNKPLSFLLTVWALLPIRDSVPTFHSRTSTFGLDGHTITCSCSYGVCVVLLCRGCPFDISSLDIWPCLTNRVENPTCLLFSEPVEQIFATAPYGKGKQLHCFFSPWYFPLLQEALSNGFPSNLDCVGAELFVGATSLWFCSWNFVVLSTSFLMGCKRQPFCLLVHV